MTVIKFLFEDMFCETIDNYTALFEILPLENLNPAVLAPYLPPGRSQKALAKPFWLKVK